MLTHIFGAALLVSCIWALVVVKTSVERAIWVVGSLIAIAVMLK